MKMTLLNLDQTKTLFNGTIYHPGHVSSRVGFNRRCVYGTHFKKATCWCFSALPSHMIHALLLIAMMLMVMDVSQATRGRCGQSPEDISSPTYMP